MNKTFEVVKAWAAFEEQYPQANIEDFCRHYLAHYQAALATTEECTDCNSHFELSRMINQLSRLWMHFTQTEIRPHNLLNFDEFAFLYTVDASDSIRKKDIIYMHFIEISSGLLVIDRLVKKAMLKETVDESDKRSKLLTITKKGSKVLKEARAATTKVAEQMYGSMPEDDMRLCLKLLTPIFSDSAQKWHQQKGFEPPSF